MVVVAAAAVLATLGGAAPTGLRLVDAVYVGGAGAALAVAGSRSPRWTWLVSGVVALWLAPTTAGRIAAVVAVVVALAAVRSGRRRILGSVVGAALAFTLGDLGAGPFHASTTLFAALAVAPMAVTAVRRLPIGQRRAVRTSASVALATAALATVVFGLAGMWSVGDVGTGIDAASRGFSLAGDGDQDGAGSAFDEARAAFDRARTKVSGVWTLPARLVPVVGQHVRAVQVVTGEGVELTRTAGDTARSVDLDDLRFVDGGLDLGLVESLQPVLDRASRAVDRAAERVGGTRSDWLVAPIAERIEELVEELDEARPTAANAALAVREVPAMLGRDAPVRWLVAVVTPAEARGLGGLLGNWALLEADDGRVELLDTGRNEDVNAAMAAAEVELEGPPQYLDRWGRFEVERFFQDVTLSPDLPMVAEVAAGLFGRSMDLEIDGVVVLDPFAIAAVLDLTGPIDADGRRLTDDTVLPFLLEEQYAEFADDEEARIRTLDAIVDATVEALTAGSVPGPRAVANELSPIVEQDRIGAWWADGGGGAELIDVTGLDNRFPLVVAGADLLGLVHQNAAQNKLDVYLRREVDYDLRVDEGRAEATVRVTLTNTLTDLTLPPAVVASNDQGLPLGTNRARVAVHTPLALAAARLDGEPVTAVPEQAFGGLAITSVIDIPPGTSRVWEVDLVGDLAVDPDTYRLTLVAQPLVHPDTVRATVTIDGVRVPMPASVQLAEDVTIGPGTD